MPVEAFIQTESRTALSYLLKPLKDQVMRTFKRADYHGVLDYSPRGCQGLNVKLAKLIFSRLVLAVLYSALVGTVAFGELGLNGDLPEADVSAYPWSAIGKLNNGVGGSCTAAVIEQDLALIAAHCIFNRRTARSASKFAPFASRI